ncbi:lipase family alpha/beta hydrolase [Nocardia sp. NPDC004722]
MRRMLSAGIIAAAVSTAAAHPAAAQPVEDVPVCRPTVQHPYPVVLLHGTDDDATAWNQLAPRLIDAGYCVYTPSYGSFDSPLPFGDGIAPVARSADDMAAYLERVRTATGAGKVDLVGHSQGGAIAEYYAKNLHHADRVNAEILLTPVTHGTTFSGAVQAANQLPALRHVTDDELLPVLCPACADLETGSPFMTALDDAPIAQPGVAYAILATRDDIINTPPGPASFIEEPGVTNQFIQDLHPAPLSHQQMPHDPAVGDWILTQLATTD